MKLALFSILLFATSCSYLPSFMQFTDDGKDVKIDIEKKQDKAAHIATRADGSVFLI